MLRRSSSPPPVMTWGKASPVLIAAVVFDLLRIIFQQFWFFGPAMLGVGAATYLSGSLGPTVGNLFGTAAGGAAAYFGSPLFAAFGMIMAMAVAFSGWLILGAWVFGTNARILKANVTGFMWFGGSLGFSLVPFIGSLPAFTLTFYKLYRTQIRVEKTEHKRWQQEQKVKAHLRSPRRDFPVPLEKAA